MLGESGDVFKCTSKETGQTVAIKRIRQSEHDRRTRQIRTLRSVAHSNIVRLLDVFHSQHHIYLVLEYLPCDLLDYLKRRPQGLPPDQVQVYALQICEAVAYCHSKNILHRDIKLENLLVDTNARNPVLKLCDFGFAKKVYSAADDLTSYVATRWYRAPELLLGSRHYTGAIDVFAIGCIVAELATGQPLFPGKNDLHQLYLLRKHLGPFTASQRAQFSANPDLMDFADDDLVPVPLMEYLDGLLPPLAMSFISSVVTMDPDLRLTSSQCLQHPYLAQIQPRTVPHQTRAKPMTIVRPPEIFNGPSAKTVPKYAYQVRKPLQNRSTSKLPNIKRQRTRVSDIHVVSRTMTHIY